MYAVEFQATVKDGIIEVPSQYHQHLQKAVRVLVLVPDTHHVSSTLIDELLKAPLSVSSFRPLTRDQSHER